MAIEAEVILTVIIDRGIEEAALVEEEITGEKKIKKLTRKKYRKKSGKHRLNYPVAPAVAKV